MEDGHNTALAPTRARHKVSNQLKNARWTREESDYLVKLVTEHGSPNWNELALLFPGKTPQQISERWEKVLDPLLVKGSWTRDEDETIVKFVAEKGTKDWTKLSNLLPGRIGKQCRERWRNHLDPEVNRSPWVEAEDEILIDLVEKIGTKWVKIAESLPGRSDNAIKNRWNSTLKKRLEYERNGGVRPKRGRPSQKGQNLMNIIPKPKPKSAGDFPRPPRIDDVAADLRGFDSPFALGTPQFVSPFNGLKSPFSFMSPTAMRGMSGMGDESLNGSSFQSSLSPRMFSPSTSLKDNRAELFSILSPVLHK